ncbi:sulfate permease [Cytobacillus kochii]|uniref:SulP family inorganic anion transporter n=1 Tax=Cytobacillus kochii TaxID=859143 RepID=UPI001CD742AC|nr:sulfate permease [Cytobacillus kochii]MCA1027265.1 sulfate permease [Cytobacillus kochii]
MLDKKYNPFISIRSYKLQTLKKDFISAMTLFVMLVPQGMAYAMLAGLPLIMGLYASTLPLIIYAIFASSRHLSVGPTAITSLLVFSGVSLLEKPGTYEYITLVIFLALMVGVFQLLLAVLKMGRIVNYISPSVLGGYTSAAAIIIGLSQLKHLLGITLGTYLQIHLIFIDLVNGIPKIHFLTLLIGGCSIVFLLVLKKINARIPGALLLLVFSIISVYAFDLHERGVQIVRGVPSGLPIPVFPTITLDAVRQLILPALTIALLGFMESLSIGKTIAEKEGYKINPNRELTALGFANFFGSFFQILPINGSFSRSAVNYQSGGVTQMVSIFTSVLVIIALQFFTSYFYYLPNAVLAAVIIVAVYKLIDFKQIRKWFNIKAVDGWSWLVTFTATLVIGIQWGIVIGVVFNFSILLIKISRPRVIEMGYLEKEKVFRDIKRFPNAKTRDDLIIARIDSSIHFSNISYLEYKLNELLLIKPNAKLVIVDFSGVNDIDAHSFKSLEEMIEQLKQEKGISLYFVGMKGPIRDTAAKAGWTKKFSKELSYFSIIQLLEDKQIKFYAQRESGDSFLYMR